MRKKIFQKKILFFFLNKKRSNNEQFFNAPSWVTFLTLFLIFSLSFKGNAQTTITITNTGSGTFAVPCDVTSITVKAWGGGGAGGGSSTGNIKGGAGGAGGAYASSIIAVTPGQSLIYNVGTGGSGGNNAGPTGQPTWFSSTSTLFAQGGAGGAAPNYGTVVGAIGSSAISIGNTVLPGMSGANGTSSVGGAGGAGANAGGAGGGQRTSEGNGRDGSVPGGGGGGAYIVDNTDHSGGNGGDGEIQITYTSLIQSYCIPNYTAGVNPITNVNFAGINNNSSNIINGSPSYELFCSSTGTVEQGGTYTISISGNTNGNNDHGVRVFFDWNHDGDFADAGESSDIGIINNTISGLTKTNTIAVPIGATIGNTRMRVTFLESSWWSIYSTSCTAGANIGQVEDYTINITPASCLRPTAILASLVTATTATITWTAPLPAPANGYDYYVTTNNTTPDNAQTPTGSVATGVTLVNLTGLTSGFTYYVWVRGNCGSGDTSLWRNQTFTTTLSNNDCTGAILLTVNAGTTCTVATDGTTANSSLSTGTVCTGNADDDVWYRFTATATSHTVTVIPGTLVNPVFQVFSSCGTSLSGGCVNTGAPVETTTLTGLNIGTTYRVRVYSFGGNGDEGTFTICVTTGTPAYCAPSSAISEYYIKDYKTVGLLNNTVNLNSGRSATGYRDYTALTAATQVPNGGINIDLYLAQSIQYVKAWVDWDKNNTFTDSGVELVYTTGGVQSIATSFGFVVPLGTAPGNYRLRVRSYEASQTFSPCGYLATGETEDYTITVTPNCTLNITSVTDGSRCDSGSVNLVAVSSGSPTQYRWYDSLTGGSLVGTTPTGSFTTPTISQKTNYYVTAFNGTCESSVRTKVVARINSSSSIQVTPSSSEVCGEGNIVTLTANGDTMTDNLINENFQGGLGSFSSVIIGGAGDASTQWQSQTSTYVPTLSVWKPAINSNTISDKFAFCTSDKNLLVNLSLESANFNTVPYTDLNLTFRQYYSYYGSSTDFAYVEVSTNNGGSWTAVRTYVEDHAVATNFEDVTVNLAPYVNNANFKIRFRYNAEFCDGWAIDDVRLYGTKPVNTTFTWGAVPVDAFIDSACTIPYVAQNVVTVYVKPSVAQLAAPSWSFTATSTLSNGCPVSKVVNINNKTKRKQGGSSNWNNPSNWQPAGVPSANDCIIIEPLATPTTILAGDSAYAKNLVIKTGGTLIAEAGSNIIITDIIDIKAGGTLNLKNNASLVQINNNANIVAGTFNMERISQPMYRYDYTYWSSPITPASGFTLGTLSPGSSLRYSWTPSIGGAGGNWASANSATVMNSNKGYIVRAPDTFSTNPAVKVPYTSNFIGTPNNGDVVVPISCGSLGALVSNDKWNLIGNPYPSAIDADKFLNLAGNNSVIDGTIYFWTHNTPPAAGILDPFYGDFAINYTAADYASLNKLGPIGTAASSLLGTGSAPSGYIAAGTAFFVKSSGVPGNVTFTNSMRLTDNNNQFFKTANTKTDSKILIGDVDFERHRIWLNLTNNSGAFSQILVGYAQGATLGKDRDFDGARFGGNGVTLYSIIPEGNMGIQGRPLPFDVNDQVILGYNAAVAGTFSVRIDHLDGLFDSQNIYLEDKLLNVFHNLKQAPYVFTTAAGNFNTRFVLRYTNSTLGNEDFNLDHNVQVITNEKVVVYSSHESIKEIVVYDLLGRKIDEYKNVNAMRFTLNHLNKTTNALIVKITLENDSIVTEKIIY